MTRDEKIAFLTHHEQLWRNRDAAALADSHADDGIIESPMMGKVVGREQILESYKKLFRAFADWHFTSQELVVDEERVAQVFRVSATHTHEFFGVDGTGKRFDVDGVLMLRFEGDRIQHERRFYDFSGLLIQLGVLRAKPPR